MNWEYIITHNNIYYDKKTDNDTFSINENNVVTYWKKNWNKIEAFSWFTFEEELPLNIKDFFNWLGTIETEKGNLMIFRNKNNDVIYLYNSYDKIPQLKNEFYYASILYEDREELIKKKTEALCNFVFINNISIISNLVKLETIKNSEEFIQNIWNAHFINTKLINYDERLLEDLQLLWTWNYIWRYWKVYMYPFLEASGKLIPIKFEWENLEDFSLDEHNSFDKVEVISFFENKNKVTLLWEKLEEKVSLFKEDVVTEEDLQKFYIELFKNNKLYK